MTPSSRQPIRISRQAQRPWTRGVGARVISRAIEPTGREQGKEQRKRPEHACRVCHVWKSLSGPRVGDDLTANVVKETPRRQTTGARLRATSGRSNRGLRPHVCARGPLNDSQTQRLRPATERRSPCSHPKQEPQPERGRLKRRERARHARDIHHARQVRHVWKSLSGPCVGDDLTANVVKETSRRHTLGARLPAAFGRSDRGPRPLVCTHGPLNDSQACQPRLVERLSHFMRVPPPFGPSVSTYRNDFQARESISAANVLRFGTGRDQASFQ